MDLPKDPKSCAYKICELAHEYGYLMDKYCDLKAQKAREWDDIRKDYKSDAGAERAWDRTIAGIEQMVIKGKLKSNENKMAALKYWQNALTLEAKNQV